MHVGPQTLEEILKIQNILINHRNYLQGLGVTLRVSTATTDPAGFSFRRVGGQIFTISAVSH